MLLVGKRAWFVDPADWPSSLIVFLIRFSLSSFFRQSFFFRLLAACLGFPTSFWWYFCVIKGWGDLHVRGVRACFCVRGICLKRWIYYILLFVSVPPCCAVPLGGRTGVGGRKTKATSCVLEIIREHQRLRLGTGMNG